MKFKQRALYAHAIAWFLEREGLEHLKVKAKSCSDPMFYGQAEHVKKNKFNIYLNPRTKGWFKKLCVVFHELIHIKQYAEGRLVATEDAWFWLGDDFTDVGYEEQPWEIEAAAAEEYLTELYLAENVG